jgi:hypothetical protein
MKYKSVERKLSQEGRGQGGLEAKLRVQTIQTPHLAIVEARFHASRASADTERSEKEYGAFMLKTGSAVFYSL